MNVSLHCAQGTSTVVSTNAATTAAVTATLRAVFDPPAAPCWE
jgi:hypothetical protein